ncbi:MAG: hypothetical protein AAGG75_23840 [Bacteroidota bacterium]
MTKNIIKKAPLLIGLLAVLLLPSCSFRYQVFNTSSSEVLKYGDDVYVYEGDDVEVYYDFWVHSGVMLFKIHNRAEIPLYIDLNKSYFRLNNKSINYQVNDIDNRDATFDHYEWHTESVVKLPPGLGIQIEGYPINHFWYPLRNGNKRSRQYDKDNSPFIFYNHISYSFNPDQEFTDAVKNYFWVSEIKKMKKVEFEDYSTTSPSTSDKFFVQRRSDDEQAGFWADLAFSILETVVFFF